MPHLLIIEDEERAASQLAAMIRQQWPEASFAPVLDSIAEAKAYLTTRPPIDLVFLDINLSDGLSFDIFNGLQLDIPIIFTTAYDQYALQAFELNSIDYLLKPIRPEKLAHALEKYQRLESRRQMVPGLAALAGLQELLQTNRSYKKNFLIPWKDRLLPVPVCDMAWFELKNGLVYGTTLQKASYVLEEKSLDELTEVLPPGNFYRVNRQFLVNRQAIREVQFYFNGRLWVNILPPPAEKVLISKARAGHFRDWLKNQ